VTVLADRQRGRLPARAEQSPAWARYAVLAAVVLAAIHVGVVAGHYVVGSFDDDGHYLALAKAFVHGKGYVDTSIPGSPVEGLYPPGYPLLIAPLIWLFGSAVWPVRLLSALAYLGCFPLLDRLLRRHPVPAGVRVATLFMFALSPTAATFGSEVMPETVFLLVLLAVLLALPRWEDEQSILSRRGAMVALGAPYLFMLKTAGLPMLVGILGWLLLRRRWRRFALVAATSVLMIAPLVLFRMSSGSVTPTRYKNEYGLAGPLLHAVWNGARTYVTDAVPATLVPTSGAGLHGHGFALDLVLWLLRESATLFVVIGLITWIRRRIDVTLLIVPLYLGETVPFPFINQRRVVLLLPLVIAWYVLGWSRVLAAARNWVPARTRGWGRYAAVLPIALVLPLLGWQLPREYLLHRGESTPAARGSGYVAALREVTPSGWSIDAGYQWTVADLTGRTATNEVHNRICGPGASFDPAVLRDIFSRDHVATVLDAWVKWPKNMDNQCVLDAMTAAPWAVPVYHGSDESTVFVLLGPGTPRDTDRVVLDVRSPDQSQASLPAGTRVTEVSVVVPATGPVPTLEVRDTSGQWVRLAATATRGSPRLLHVRLAAPMPAGAVRVGGPAGGAVHDLVVLGVPG
jgi:dolichyl-phosphate-mannose-protein mannosyltransferase